MHRFSHKKVVAFIKLWNQEQQNILYVTPLRSLEKFVYNFEATSRGISRVKIWFTASETSCDIHKYCSHPWIPLLQNQKIKVVIRRRFFQFTETSTTAVKFFYLLFLFFCSEWTKLCTLLSHILCWYCGEWKKTTKKKVSSSIGNKNTKWLSKSYQLFSKVVVTEEHNVVRQQRQRSEKTI